MKKLIIWIAMLTAVITLPAIAWAEPAQESDFEFDAETGTITKYLGSGSEVEIPGSIGGTAVTAIGGESFMGCDTVTEVTIPNGITKIGSYAFNACGNLKNVVIPNSVLTISSYAFAGCDKLMNLTIPSSVTQITTGAFNGCSSLTSVVIPDGVTEIDGFVFRECSSLREITIPGSVKLIEYNAFEACTALRNVKYGGAKADLEMIEVVEGNEELKKADFVCTDGTFKGSEVLWLTNEPIREGDFVFIAKTGTIQSYEGNSSTVEIPETIGGRKVLEIGKWAFSECHNLAEITIPGSVKLIEWNAFGDCTGLRNVKYGASKADLEMIEIATDNNEFMKADFVCTDGTFKGSEVSWLSDEPVREGDFVFIPRTGTIQSYEGNSSIVEIPETICGRKVLEIGGEEFTGAFEDCEDLVKVTFPPGSNVKRIGEYAFEHCSSLNEITLPSSVTDIGWEAFRGCDSLTQIVIPASVTDIGVALFSDCNNLTNISVDSGNKKFDSRNNCNAVIETESNTLVAGCNKTVIPASVTSIGSYALEGCGNIARITIPDNVTSIGGWAFSDCKALEEITIPAGVTSIGEAVFSGCDNLAKINVDSKNGIFDSRNNCNAIIETESNVLLAGCKKTVIPASVTSIGEEAFYDCDSLTQITIPDSVASIGSRAFKYCKNLTKVTIPASVTSIERDSFANCDENLTLHVQAGSYAEAYTKEKGLKYVYISADDETGSDENPGGNVSQPEKNPGDNVNLPEKNPETPGTTTQPPAKGDSQPSKGDSQPSKGDSANPAPDTNQPSGETSGSLPAAGEKLSDTKTKAVYVVTGSGSAVAYAGTTDKKAVSLSVPATIKSDGVTYKVTSIEKNALKNNKKLQKVTISGSVSNIGASAFQGCSALKTVKMGSKVTAIGDKAFSGCKKLSSLTIGKNVSSIGKSAFQNCAALKKITIPAKVKKIGASAFSGCKKLTGITIKSQKLTEKNVGSKAFAKAGSSNYKKMKVTVPAKKYAAYKKLLKKKGISGKAKVVKK